MAGGYVDPSSKYKIPVPVQQNAYTPPLPVKPKVTPKYGDPATTSAAINTQASDYDKIMKGYSDYLANLKQNPLKPLTVTPQTVNPTTTQYEQSKDVTGSLSNLSDLATTGGYSPENIADIRARDTSPIRSIYSNAQRAVDRQRVLQGGYSPNFGALTAKLARDTSTQVGDVVTNANAGIAQNIASNRLAAASPYANTALSANQMKTSVDQRNADIINQINESNAARDFSAKNTNVSNDLEAQLATRQGALGALGGQTSLYGTTPALVSTFGNQVAQNAQTNQSQQQIDAQRRRDALNWISQNSVRN